LRHRQHEVNSEVQWNLDCTCTGPALLHGTEKISLTALGMCSGRIWAEAGLRLDRSALLDGMQKLGLRHRKRRQQWALAILLATKGMELTRLKSFLDDGGDYHTFYKLVYNDLQVQLVYCRPMYIDLHVRFVYSGALFDYFQSGGDML
jgi:hypothetical protein